MEQMYRYIKGHEKKLPWRAISADENERLKLEGIGFATVLLCTEKVRKGTSVSDNAKYVGPFYLDIDDDNIKKSIKSAKTVLKKLEKFGVPDNAVKIWATGKRGFHFLIEMEYFTTPEPTERLAHIYKFMMLAMKLPDNVDHTVYSGGKGRMWRIENKKRIDNGKYKVPISPAELRELTPEVHDQLVAEPREIPEPPAFTGKLGTLAAMFRLAKSKAAEMEKPQAMFIDPEIIESMDGKLTPCAEMMRTGTDLKPLGFNAISMQFGKAVAAFSPDDPRDLIQEFAENYPGESYDTVRKRRDHTMVVFRTAMRDSNYRWSCRSALGVLKHEPCEGCPIVHLRFADEEEDDGIQDADTAPVFNLSTRTFVDKEAAQSSKPVNGAAHHHVNGSAAVNGKAHLNGHSAVEQAAEIEFHADEESEESGVEAEEAEDVDQRSTTFALPTDTVDLDDPDAVIPTLKIPSKAEREKMKLAAAAQKIADAGVGVRSAKPLPPRAAAATTAAPPASDPPEKKKKKPKAEKPTDLDADNDVGLLVTDKGYAFLAGEGLRHISNFTILIHRYYTEWVPNLKEERRVAVAARVFVDNSQVGSIIIEEQNWGSRAAFNNCLSGLSNAAFYGKDDDVIKMKTALMANINETAERVRRVGSIGVHRLEVVGQQMMTYVEPGWSIDNFGYENKYYFNDILHGAPELYRASDLGKGDMMVETALRAMMRINEPVAMAHMFPWYMACFIKEHCKAYSKEFPLLGLHGNRGSGKTKGAEVLALLHGYERERAGLTTNLPMVSPFAIWKTIASTTTLPVVCDEYNASKMKREKFNDLGEIFKEVYQYGSVKRGTLSQNRGAGSSAAGAHVQEFALTAPVVVCSEQGITMPALVQRTVQVPLSPASLRLPGVNDNYRYVITHADDFQRFAKAAYMFAINLSVEEVRDWLLEYKDQISLELGDRPQHSFAILLAGLKFFEKVCEKYEISLLEEIDAMRNTLLKYLETEHLSITEAKNRSEIDIVIEKLATMASINEADSSNQGLRLLSGVHYVLDGNSLFLDAPVCHMLYQQYCSRVEHSTPVITDYLSFRALLRNEPYTISTTSVKSGFARERPVVELDLEKLSIKGIDVASFEQIGDDL